MLNLRWCGAELITPSLDDKSMELARLLLDLETACDGILDTRAFDYLPLELRRAAEDLSRAYSLAGPLFTVHRDFTPERMLARSSEYWAVLTEVSRAELAWITALASARAKWLLEALRSDSRLPASGK